MPSLAPLHSRCTGHQRHHGRRCRPLHTTEELTGLRCGIRKRRLPRRLRRGDPDDPIPAMLVLRDAYGNRVELLGGLRGHGP